MQTDQFKGKKQIQTSKNPSSIMLLKEKCAVVLFKKS